MQTEVKLARTLFQRLSGLLFKDPGKPLLLVRCSDIHTFGMRYSIDVAFFDREGRCVASERSLKPFRRRRYPDAVSVLERRAASDPWPRKGDGCTFIATSLSKLLLSFEPIDEVEANTPETF